MFSFCYAPPLLPFFDIFSGTHVRPCVQVATPLVTDVVTGHILENRTIQSWRLKV